MIKITLNEGVVLEQTDRLFPGNNFCEEHAGVRKKLYGPTNCSTFLRSFLFVEYTILTLVEDR